MRSSSIVLVLLLSSASLTAQRATSPAQYVEPPSSQGCPVVFSANRVTTSGLSQAGNDAQPQTQQMMVLQQQVAELEAKRNQTAAKLAELPAGADHATALQLRNQIQALDVDLAAKRVMLKQLTESFPSDLKTPHNSGSGQGLQVSFKRSPAAITGVDLTVHGVSMSAHMTPAAQSSRASDLSETFHLSGSAAEPLLESALRTNQPMVITWVELTRLEYANGTAWQKTASSQCAAAPSLFVLVDR